MSEPLIPDVLAPGDADMTFDPESCEVRVNGLLVGTASPELAAPMRNAFNRYRRLKPRELDAILRMDIEEVTLPNGSKMLRPTKKGHQP